MNEECECGHVLDEHDDNFLNACTICDCISYDAKEEDENE